MDDLKQLRFAMTLRVLDDFKWRDIDDAELVEAIKSFLKCSTNVEEVRCISIARGN